jgi:hypothetical protein
MDRNKTIEIVARIGVFGTFLGHGIAALFVNSNWIPLLTCYGFSIDNAKELMPLIGILDIVVAFVILIYPIRIVLIWAVFWTFMTALSRPISGSEWIELVERSANWCLPLILLYMQGFPNSFSSLFKIKA